MNKYTVSMKDLARLCESDKNTTRAFYRGTIPTLEVNKCACMHGQKLRHARAIGGA